VNVPCSSLSADDVKGFDDKINQTIERINNVIMEPMQHSTAWPSINFALETAWRDLRAMGSKILYPSDLQKVKILSASTV